MENFEEINKSELSEIYTKIIQTVSLIDKNIINFNILLITLNYFGLNLIFEKKMYNYHLYLILIISLVLNILSIYINLFLSNKNTMKLLYKTYENRKYPELKEVNKINDETKKLNKWSISLVILSKILTLIYILINLILNDYAN